MQGPQRHRRLETELLVEDRAGAGVHLEGIGLSSAAIQRGHEQASQGLPRGVLCHHGLQLTDGFQVPAQGEGDLGAFGQGGEPQLVEPHCLGRGPLLGAEVGQRVALPERQCLVVRPQLVVRVVARRGGGS